MNRVLNYSFIVVGAFLAYLFYLIFQGKLIAPQAFHIGSFPIRHYGIILALAVFAAYTLAIKRSFFYQVPRDKAEDIIFWVIVGGFIGARVYHVLSNLPYYLQNPADIIMIWHGGLSVIGSLVGGLIAAYLKSRYLKAPQFIRLLDWLAPSMVLGQIIGRFADLFNYELFGYPTNLPWKMFVPIDFRPVAYMNAAYFHPLFLYEALGNVVILFWLLKKSGHWSQQKGRVFLTYLMMYGSLRFFLEFLRIDSVFIGDLRLNAIMSMVFILAGFIGLYLKKANFDKQCLTRR